MDTRFFLYIAGIVILLLTGVFVVRNYAGEQADVVKQDLPKGEMVIVYAKGKETRLLPEMSLYHKIKGEVEGLVTNANDTYRLIPSESRFDKLKKKGKAVELIYASSKELPITLLARPFKITKILIPLSGGDFPPASLFVYEDQRELPHILANTIQSKENLLKLIE